jgi:hypothetical protein
MFENFQGELFADEYPKRHGAEPSKVATAKAAKMLGELTMAASKFSDAPKLDQAEMKAYVMKYLMARGVDEVEADAFFAALKKLSFNSSIREKKKIDQDGDGDTDFVDAKVAQYKAGGIPKDQAIKKAKMFAKKNLITDKKI